MKAQCLPFSQIPHTTRLFADFLSWAPAIQRFYPRSPHFEQWLNHEAPNERYDPARREQVAAILERQNRDFGASVKAQENLGRFRAGASAVVTGQQVGLFGGPVFSIYKALTAIKLAEQATKAGVDCVPVFWLATTDHDLAEVNHIFIPGPDGIRRELATPTHSVDDAPVSAITFGEEISPVVQEAAELLGDSVATSALREAYRPGENFGGAFARLFAQLFANYGVVLVEASDPELNAIAAPIYRSALERAAELDEALLARGRELEAQGYHQQVKVTPSSTLLFALQSGSRMPIHRRLNGAHADEEFLIGEEAVPRTELFRRIEAEPGKFSPNVLLRPVIQDYLFPTLAYTGGSAEVAYFAQAEVPYRTLLGHVTPIVPRFSATLIEAKPQSLLERYSLSLPDLFNGPEAAREALAKRALPQDLQSAFDQADILVKNSMAKIQDSLDRLDKTLVEAAANAQSKMQHQLDQLRSRAARAELRQSEVLNRHADLLSNALYPNKSLQERETAAIYFLGRYGLELVDEVYKALHTDCLDHQVISL